MIADKVLVVLSFLKPYYLFDIFIAFCVLDEIHFFIRNLDQTIVLKVLNLT